jgi:putative glutamine amidotransferase
LKPIIGVMPLWDEEKDSIWMLPGYMDGIREAGGLPLIFPLTDDAEDLKRLVSMCRGILLTGGQDVAPEIYHETPLEGLIEGCTLRDRMETIVLKAALEQDLPVLGICRGIQFINAALGGTLFQDLPLQHPSEVCHRQKPPYDEPAHTVQVLPGTPLSDCLIAEEISVNSCHHQAIRELAPKLEVMACSPDGLVEAVHMPGRRFVWAVQWHPEFSYKTDENSRKILRAFVDATEICPPSAKSSSTGTK